MIEKTFQYETKDLAAVTPQKLILLTNIVVFAVFVFFVVAKFADHEPLVGLIVGGTLAATFGLIAFLFYKKRKKQQMRQWLLEGEVTFSANESGITIGHRKNEFHIVREGLRTVIDRQYWWLFCFSDKRWFVLPKRIFSKAEVQQLGEWLPCFNQGKGQPPDKEYLAKKRSLTFIALVPRLLVVGLLVWMYYR